MEAVDPLGGLGNIVGGFSHVLGDLTGGALAGGLGGATTGALSGAATASGLGGVVPNVMNTANNMVNGVTRPVMGLLGSLTGAGGAGGIVNDALRMTGGALSGLTSGASAGANLAGLGGSALAGTPAGAGFGLLSGGLRKREAIGSGFQEVAENGAIEAGAHFGAAAAVGVPGAAAAEGVMAANMLGGGGVGGVAGAVGPAMVANHVAAAADTAIAANVATQTGAVAAAPLVAGRAALAGEAMRNAQAESALAGADMVAHGANNARSASLASNAYRQAKLAGARDRVNIAGTIQNSARISDAAIATHDAATRAEDSLLGSELAVDSASTVLDSDGAYIPPVTSSLLRSLPYGRLGVRNIVPKPLTYPGVLLPDVWLNGVPVNYLNVPMRMLPYTIGSTAATNPLWSSGASLANGQIINGQPFIANNGMLINGMVVDPAVAYMSTGGALAMNGLAGSSIMPVLANGQLEAQDEVAAANMVTMQQLGGAGMSGTYQGYGRLNPVPMITGSVSDVNLMPTTTVGTTYPIGSALVIEPRDSFFQDYVDNASSRQNYDEREQ